MPGVVVEWQVHVAHHPVLSEALLDFLRTAVHKTPLRLQVWLLKQAATTTMEAAGRAINQYVQNSCTVHTAPASSASSVKRKAYKPMQGRNNRACSCTVLISRKGLRCMLPGKHAQGVWRTSCPLGGSWRGATRAPYRQLGCPRGTWRCWLLWSQCTQQPAWQHKSLHFSGSRQLFQVAGNSQSRSSTS
jgi:hypothetical protein